MSTKIMNGYTIPRLNHQELMVFLKRVRKEMLQVARKEYIRLLATEAAYTFDEIKFNVLGQDKKYGNTTNPVYASVSYLWKRNDVIQSRKIYDPLFDLSSEVVVIPTNNGPFLVLLFTQNKKLKEFWHNQPEVMEYFYWDHGDAPENISEKVWNKRKSDWENNLSDGPVLECGYSYTFVDFLHINSAVRRNDLLKNLPCVEVRESHIYSILSKGNKNSLENEKIMLNVREKIKKNLNENDLYQDYDINKGV